MDNLPFDGDLSKTIESIMADEKFADVLAAVKSSFSANAENPPSALPASSAEDEEADGTEAATVIPQIPPELISKLPEIMGILSKGSPVGGKNTQLDDRKRLLTALKPFLSDQRKNAVDSIVSIAGIADLFGI